jgi:hypothetical protein
MVISTATGIKQSTGTPKSKKNSKQSNFSI